jgi:hypothetical protein
LNGPRRLLGRSAEEVDDVFLGCLDGAGCLGDFKDVQLGNIFAARGADGLRAEEFIEEFGSGGCRSS